MSPRRTVRKQPPPNKEPRKESQKTLKAACEEMLDDIRDSQRSRSVQPLRIEPKPITEEEVEVMRMIHGPGWKK